jgi:hypothetical protein
MLSDAAGFSRLQPSWLTLPMEAYRVLILVTLLAIAKRGNCEIHFQEDRPMYRAAPLARDFVPVKPDWNEKRDHAALGC